MKVKMKYVLIILSLAVVTVTSHAQTKFGVRAGMNFSNVTAKPESGGKAETQSLPGFTFGLTAEIALAGDFFIQPDLLYSRKGFKQHNGGFNGSANNFKVKADYIELPVTVIYKPKLGTGHLVLGAGPYIAYGAGGNWKSDSEITIGDIRSKGDGKVTFRNDASVRNDSEYNYGRPLDYGLNGILGYQFRESLSLQLTGMLGVANLVPHFNGFDPGGSLRNKGFGISLGYKF